MEESELVVVTRARNGDAEAFRTLVERHSRNVFKLAYRMTRNEMDAEDVVQETFLKVFQSLESFEERASFSTWLFRVTANCSIDWMRRHRKHEDRKEEMVPETERKRHVGDRAIDDQLLFRVEIQRRVSSGFEELSSTEKAAFVLRHFEGWSIEEIGRSLSLGPNAVKHSIFRAVQKMRRVLAPMVGGQEWLT